MFARPPSAAGLASLRGRHADGRLRALERQRARVRPVLGALALQLVNRRAHEALGFRSLGDFGRERLGVGARTLREWARVWRALEALPCLRGAVLAGEVSWTAVRKIVALATPETDAACLETVRGRTVRAVEAMVRAVVRGEEGSAVEEAPGEERVAALVPCPPEVLGKWEIAVELARRAAGEALPVWEAAEAIAAEGASAVGAPDAVGPEPVPPTPARSAWSGAGAPRASDESGLRARVWPHLRWSGPGAPADPGADPLARLLRGLDRAEPRSLDRRLRAAMRFLQRVDYEIGRLLRQVLDRRLHRELGFDTFDRYVRERLDLAPRTARRLVRIARAEHRRPAVATAFRAGRITLLQAEALLRGKASVRFARSVTLRRLEDETRPRALSFTAPRSVAVLFLAMVARMGLEPLLDHAIATWTEAGRRFRDYADFERDGWRCTVPGCTARRNLQSHHVVFRSAGGADEPGNRTTLCAFHHQRGVHGGALRLRGRAPHALVYELGVGRYASGDRLLPEHPARVLQRGADGGHALVVG